jgi:hypothetical protein
MRALSARAIPINRMGTSWRMAGGSLADLNYGRCALRTRPRWSIIVRVWL